MAYKRLTWLCVSLIGACGTNGAPLPAQAGLSLTGRLTHQQAMRDVTGAATLIATIQVSALGAQGAMTILGETQSNALGEWTLVIPANHKQTVAHAIDASGHLLGGVIVQTTGLAGDRATVAPVTLETSIEAAVLLAMSAEGLDVSDINTIDLSTRVDASLAERIAASADKVQRIRDVAAAVVAAQRTKLAAMLNARTQVTAESWYDRELGAALVLNTAKYEGSYNEAAVAAFFKAIDALDVMSPSTRASVEASASIAWRKTLQARIEGTSDGVLDAGIGSAAKLEARALVIAVNAALTADGAPERSRQKAQAAGQVLLSRLAAYASASESEEAFLQFQEALTGRSDVMTSVFGLLLDVSDQTTNLALASIAASTFALDSMESALDDSIYATISGTLGAINFEAQSAATVSARANFEAAVLLLSNTTLASFANRTSAVAVLLLSEGAFR
jgi:hypothetical protein